MNKKLSPQEQIKVKLKYYSTIKSTTKKAYSLKEGTYSITVKLIEGSDLLSK